MLYPKNQTEKLEKELFENPTSEYRAAPFWAWNCKLDKDKLLRQIEHLKEMGMGGYHIHARNGLATEYLGTEFIDLVKACNEKGKQEGMLTWLYDEDRYPSGSAGGEVTKDREYSGRYLLFTPYPYGQAPKDKDLHILFSVPRQENGELLARYLVELDDSGYLSSYRRLYEGENPAGRIWYAYLEINPQSPWFNRQTYADTMNRKAVERFIELTHEKYYQAVGEEFGKSIPGIFTDEPQMEGRGRLDFSRARKDVTMPCTRDLTETFKKEYGYDFLDKLPELYWELADGRLSPLRYHYHRHTNDRFYRAFFETIGDWCASHHICFTGHLMSEQSLLGQYLRLGEAMRLYNAFQLPGIDILADNHEYTTVKQAQSVVRQKRLPGMLSELDGVTNWDYDFRGHKLQGDWQAALGVTVRVPHLTWVSMEGEAKRDYPASIGYQSPWYREYNLIEDHFARVNTALTRGKPEVRVAVIHPIESYWLCSGPQDKTMDTCTEMDDNFHLLCEWLLFGQIDFDYISESLLPGQCKTGGAPLRVGEMAYDAVIVADCRTLRSSTLDRLEAFREAGGMVLFTGRIPALIDAMPSERPRRLAEAAETVPFSKTSIVNTLERFRTIDIRSGRGNRTDTLIYQMRRDGEDKWLFLCHGKNPPNPDIVPEEDITITLDGVWEPVLYDTVSGEIYPIAYHHEMGHTIIRHSFYAHDSMLLRLTPSMDDEPAVIAEKTKQVLHEVDVPASVPVRLSEPNVLLLDLAEYAYDDGPWQKREEILRIDAEFREKLGYPKRDGQLVQPYMLPETNSQDHFIRLRFAIISEAGVSEPLLAMEHPESAEITWNGQEVGTQAGGWFVDEAIKTIKLPPIQAGENILELKVWITERKGAEWCYILGDFGVRVGGSRCMLTEPVRALAFGDWSGQGLPFYAGNVTYCMEVETKDTVEIEAAHFRNPVLRVDLDGEKKGLIAFAPYRIRFSASPGKHSLEITAYGNRHNAFGAVHNADITEDFFGPWVWRSTGLAWSYEYRLKPIGVLASPCIRI